MEIADIEKLAQVHASPAVSILCPLERRRPGNLEDPRRLAALRARALSVLGRGHDPDTVERLVERLDEAIATIDLTHPADGVAILSTADESHVLALWCPIRARVIVNETFATRDLLDAVQQTMRTRVLVFDAEHARCFQAAGPTLTEIVGHGFPLSISPRLQEDTPHRDLPIGEHERAEAHRFVLRGVDDAIAALQRDEREPLIVVATGRELAYFDEVTDHRDDIIERVHGSHVNDHVAAIERVVAPAIQAALESRAADAVQRATESVGARGVSGLDEVARAAEEGRGHELFLEHDLTVAAPAPAFATGDRLEDPIDEVVGAVLRHAGRVTIVPSGALAQYDGIVMALRY